MSGSVAELDRLLPADRNVVYDAGNFLQCAPYLSVPGPAHIKQASDFSSIGMGFGTALGFACGDPGRTTVAVRFIVSLCLVGSGDDRPIIRQPSAPGNKRNKNALSAKPAQRNCPLE